MKKTIYSYLRINYYNYGVVSKSSKREAKFGNVGSDEGVVKV